MRGGCRGFEAPGPEHPEQLALLSERVAAKVPPIWWCTGVHCCMPHRRSRQAKMCLSSGCRCTQAALFTSWTVR